MQVKDRHQAGQKSPQIPTVWGFFAGAGIAPQMSVRASQEGKSESLLRKHGIFRRRRYRHQVRFWNIKNMMGCEYFFEKICIFLRTVA